MTSDSPEQSPPPNGLQQQVVSLQKENASLNKKLEEVIPANEKLMLENQKLIADNFKLRGGPVLKPEEVSALKSLHDAREPIHADTLAKAMSIDGARADDILEGLVKSGHASYRGGKFYEIEQKGRDALH